jgi:hypothetical protein
VPIVSPSVSAVTSSLLAFVPAEDMTSREDNNDGDDKVYFANTSTKKNKFRGFFRRVSRTFNKTAHVDNSNNDAILIGSFRVALK